MSIEEKAAMAENAAATEKYRAERVAEIRALQASRQGEDPFTKPITGELHNWQRQFIGKTGDYVIWGNIQNESGVPRFRNNEWIRTSLIAKVEGDIAMTLNSVYRLIGEEVKGPDHDD